MNWTRGAWGGLIGGSGVVLGFGLGGHLPLLAMLGLLGFVGGIVQLRRLDRS